jgi:hypothetical protein
MYDVGFTVIVDVGGWWWYVSEGLYFEKSAERAPALMSLLGRNS